MLIRKVIRDWHRHIVVVCPMVMASASCNRRCDEWAGRSRLDCWSARRARIGSTRGVLDDLKLYVRLSSNFPVCILHIKYDKYSTLIMLECENIRAAGGGVGGAARSSAVAVMRLSIHAIVRVAIVVDNGEGGLGVLLKTVNGNSVCLDGAGDVIVEISQVNTGNGASILTCQLERTQVFLLLRCHVVVLPVN